MKTIDMSNVDTLGRVAAEKKRLVLGGAILKCMIDNHMTLRDLDNACEEVKKFYRGHALLCKCED